MTLELTLEKTLHAPREQVFDAWLQPDTLAKFMMPAPEVTIPEVEVDARVGGAFLIVMQVGERKMPHRGEYRSIRPHDEIAFTWVSDNSRGDSLVTLTFEAVSESETLLTLHQRGFDSEEARNNHQGGWSKILDVLGAALLADAGRVSASLTK